MNTTKDNVILFLMSKKDDIALAIDDILYNDLSKSLTFKELQQIDHQRQNMQKIYDIIDFLEKEID